MQSGTFDFGRTFRLASDAYGKQVGLGIGVTLLLPLIMVAMVLTCVGIFLGIPALMAGIPVFGYLMIRREASIGDLFSGFRSYGWVLLAFLLIYLLSSLISLPFAIPYVYYLYGDFPFSSLGGEESGEAMKIWSESIALKQQGLLQSGQIWRLLFVYLSYPISFYIGARMQLLYPLIILRGMTATEAMQESWRLTGPYQWWLMLLQFVSGVIAFAGVILCGVGICFSFPYSLALQGAATYQLFGEDTGSSPAA